MTKFRFKLLQL